MIMRLFELNELQPFDTTRVTKDNTSDFDSGTMPLLKDREYWHDWKATVWEIEWMSPSEYIERCITGFKNHGGVGAVRRGREEDPRIADFAAQMQQGVKFGMPYLDYRRNGFTQEGLHRAMAAEKIGVRNIPVLMIYSRPEKEEEKLPVTMDDNEDYLELERNLRAGTLGESTLTEGISPIVYHYTNVGALLNILKTNRFKLAASVGVDAEREHQKEFYFLSTTRHRLGGYHEGSVQGVMLELDGTKLAHHHKGTPIDYWGPDWGPATKKEAEDRIYSRTPYIENAKGFIKSIHLYFGEWAKEHFNNIRPYYRAVYSGAKKAGIPVYFYEDKKTWLTQFHWKAAVKLPDYIKQSGSVPNYSERMDPAHRAKRFIGAWVELYTVNDKDKLSERAARLLYNIKYDHFDEQYRQLAADMHNNKTQPEGGMTTLLKIFKKEGISSPKEYINVIKNKWGMDNE